MIDRNPSGSAEPIPGAERTAPANFSDLFTARIPSLIAQYRGRLYEISSPLASDAETWEQCELQARRIFDDCLRSFAAGRTTLPHITDVFDPGAERVRQGAHITHSVRAGSILSDLTITALAECAAQAGAPQTDFVAAVRALQQGIGLRLESGSIGYDAFLLQLVREAHEQGQRRLGREIHDHIGNSVSLALRQIELYELECERALDDSESTESAEVSQASRMSRHVQLAKEAILETIARSRELVSELRRAGVTGSLETALRGFAASLGHSGAPLQMWVRGNDQWIPGSVTEELFIMVRECLRNAYTHAGAASIAVNIEISPHQVHAEIIDNGKGFDFYKLRQAGHGNGLVILQERSNLVGGTVNIDSAPGRGTWVTLWIPIARERQVA